MNDLKPSKTDRVPPSGVRPERASPRLGEYDGRISRGPKPELTGLGFFGYVLLNFAISNFVNF